MPEIIEIITQDLPDVTAIAENNYIVEVEQTVTDVNVNLNNVTVEILNPHTDVLVNENKFLVEVTPPLINEINVVGIVQSSGDMTRAVYDPNNVNGNVFNRANHTGTQAQNTVTNLISDLASKVGGTTGVIDNSLLRSDGTGGATIQSSGITIDDTSSLVFPTTAAGSTTGVVYKGTVKFLHNYYGTGTNGSNIFLGEHAGNFTMGGAGDQGSYNLGVGTNSLKSITTGNYNAAVGAVAGFNLTTGLYNFALGGASLFTCTTGNNNVALGVGALYSLTTGNSNIAIGFESMVNATTGSGNIMIGDSTNPSSNTVSNELNIGKTFYGKGLGGAKTFLINGTSGELTIPEGVTMKKMGVGEVPATPPPGFMKLFFKSNGSLFKMDENGTETLIG